MARGGRRTAGPVVIGSGPSSRRRPPLWALLVAVAALVASVWGMQALGVRPVPSDPDVEDAAAPVPPSFELVEATDWSGPADPSQWTVSRVYAAADGRGLAFTVRTRFRHDLAGANADVAGEPARAHYGSPRQPALIEWNDAGFAYTLLGMGITLDELIKTAEGVAFDWAGVGSTVVPRPGYLPPGLDLVDVRAGPSGDGGTGTSGRRITYRSTTDPGARITIVVSEEAVVTAAHLAGLFRFDPGGGERLAFGFPPARPAGGGLRWMIEDRDDSTVTVAATDVSVDELARALLALSSS